MAARRLHDPVPSSHTPSPGLASSVSLVVVTVKTLAGVVTVNVAVAVFVPSVTDTVAAPREAELGMTATQEEPTTPLASVEHTAPVLALLKLMVSGALGLK